MQVNEEQQIFREMILEEKKENNGIEEKQLNDVEGNVNDLNESQKKTLSRDFDDEKRFQTRKDHKKVTDAVPIITMRNLFSPLTKHAIRAPSKGKNNKMFKGWLQNDKRIKLFNTVIRHLLRNPISLGQ